MRARQIVFINLMGILIVALALAGGYVYFYNRDNYVSENDAHVSVDSQYIVSTQAGKLIKWSAQDGSKVAAGDVVGVEQLPTGQQIDITTPIDGQVLQTKVSQAEVVSPGMMLGVVANLNHEFITAYIKETDIRNVKAGQNVDIYLDAYPGQSFSGTVENIGSESAANASPFPSTTSSGANKEVQRIPVKISLSGKNGKYIVPGMNVSIRIHRHS